MNYEEFLEGFNILLSWQFLGFFAAGLTLVFGLLVFFILIYGTAACINKVCVKK